MTQQQRANRTGIFLGFLLVGLLVYSFVVIKTRGNLPEPKNLTRLQRILRGL